MDLECAICCNLLTEEPDVEGPTLPPKRPRPEPVAGPSSGPVAPPAPQLCVPKCGHMFHKTCLINWIRISKSRTCPSCRKSLTERQLTTVFLPAVSQEEKKCQNCEITSKTCEEVTAEKEQLKGLFEKEVERREGAEMEVKKGVEVMENHVNQLNKETVEIQRKFLEEERKVAQLSAKKKQLEKLYKMVEEWWTGAEMKAKKVTEEMNDRVHECDTERLKIEGKVDQLTKEKEQLTKLLKEEVGKRTDAEMEAKKSVEVNDIRVQQIIKEKAEIEGRLLQQERKVGVLEQKVKEERRKGKVGKMRGDRLQEDNTDLQEKFLQESDKVEEKQGTLNELQERHRLLIGDVEEMTKRYEVEQEKANILEGRVASLEAQLQQDQSQSEGSMVDTSDSDADE